MKISLIVAMSENYVIGNEGKMPWNIPNELQRFKALTTNKSVIMGRKTFNSIGNALPNRKNIVISRQKNIEVKDGILVSSLKEALELCNDEKEVFIIGGGEIYKQCIGIADKIYLTVIHKEFHGDTLFPKFDWKKYRNIYEERINESIEYTYYTLEKI